MLKIHYQLAFNDFLIYQKKYFDYQINPAIKDTLAAWQKFLFYVQLLLCICIFFIANFQVAALVFSGLMLIYGILIYTKQLPKLYWQLMMKRNISNYVLQNYFQGNKEHQFVRNIEISQTGIELIKENKTIFYLWDNVRCYCEEQDYLFLFFSDYEGTIIPLKQLTESQKRTLLESLNTHLT